jgi:hypothetical protein
MPRFDSPFLIVAINENNSTVTLDLPATSKCHPILHTSQVLPFVENNASLFPSHEFSKPPPIIDGAVNEEYLVRDIIDERGSGWTSKYLVRWIGYGEEENRWLPCKLLEDTEALDSWLAQKR